MNQSLVQLAATCQSAVILLRNGFERDDIHDVLSLAWNLYSGAFPGLDPQAVIILKATALRMRREDQFDPSDFLLAGCRKLAREERQKHLGRICDYFVNVQADAFTRLTDEQTTTRLQT